MSKIWRERANPKKHRDFMSTHNEGGIPVEAPKDNLIDKWVYFVEVFNFTFQFVGIEQVKQCKEYFSKSIHPSSRKSGHDLEHYWHPWYSKLPKGINKGVRRQKVLKLLGQILEKWDSQ